MAIDETGTNKRAIGVEYSIRLVTVRLSGGRSEDAIDMAVANADALRDGQVSGLHVDNSRVGYEIETFHHHAACERDCHCMRGACCKANRYSTNAMIGAADDVADVRRGRLQIAQSV